MPTDATASNSVLQAAQLKVSHEQSMYRNLTTRKSNNNSAMRKWWDQQKNAGSDAKDAGIGSFVKEDHSLFETLKVHCHELMVTFT